MSALHLRHQHRPVRPMRPYEQAAIPTVTLPARCECGARATHTVAFIQFNSSGAAFTNYLHVCSDCAAIMSAEDTVTRIQ